MQMERCDGVHLTIRNLFGSVEHYFHFFLGYLLPLVDWYSRSEGEKWSRVCIRSCALFDPLILELGYDNLLILDKELHKAVGGSGEFEGHLFWNSSIFGFDHPSRFSSAECEGASRLIQRRLNLDPANDRLAPGRPVTKRVLLIERVPSDPFYQSDNSEIKSAGADRRSIPNMDEIEKALALWQPVRVSMEGLSLREQVSLFQSADVVIAQHGAALANLFFSRSSTAVIEIIPKDLPPAMKEAFISIAIPKGMRYMIVDQESAHSPVKASDLVSALAALD